MSKVALTEEQDALSTRCFAGFPAGTVSGAPKIRAMEIIDELEIRSAAASMPAPSAISAPTAPWTPVSRSGLRCSRTATAFVQAGGGVVADSDPETELQETINKSKALIRAAEEAGRFAQRGNR